MDQQLPRTITLSVRTVIAVALAATVITVLTFVQSDAVLIAWAQGNVSATDALARGGVDALRESSLYLPKFGQLAVVSLIWFVMLVWVLCHCLVGGHAWARIVLTATGLVGVLVAAVSLANHLPTSFAVASGAMLLLDAVLIALLWHKDTTAYLRSF